MRDRAILRVGWIGGFRRSELCDIERSDIEEHPLGLRIVVRRSMTDQEGKGQDKAIPLGLSQRTCPVRALNVWLSEAQFHDGPVFRGIDRHGNVRPGRLTDCVIDRIVKSTAQAAGLESARPVPAGPQSSAT
jgi:integrase